MVASTQITNTEIFAYIALPVCKLLGCKVLLINRKDNRIETVKKWATFYKKTVNFTSRLLQNYK